MTDTVERNIARVRDAQKRAIAQAGGHLLSDSAAASTARALTPQINSWADRGHEADRANGAPRGGWTAWLTQGDEFVKGFRDLGASDNITEAFKDTLAKAPETSAHAAASIVRKTSKVVGDAAGSIVRPVASGLSPLLWPIAIVAVLAGGCYIALSRPRRA